MSFEEGKADGASTVQINKTKNFHYKEYQKFPVSYTCCAAEADAINKYGSFLEGPSLQMLESKTVNTYSSHINIFNFCIPRLIIHELFLFQLPLKTILNKIHHMCYDTKRNSQVYCAALTRHNIAVSL